MLERALESALYAGCAMLVIGAVGTMGPAVWAFLWSLSVWKALFLGGFVLLWVGLLGLIALAVKQSKPVRFDPDPAVKAHMAEMQRQQGQAMMRRHSDGSVLGGVKAGTGIAIGISGAYYVEPQNEKAPGARGTEGS